MTRPEFTLEASRTISSATAVELPVKIHVSVSTIAEQPMMAPVFDVLIGN
jgi:hypothetical protein